MQGDIKRGKYKCLCLRKNEKEIYIVGGRGERWMEMSYNKNEVIFLFYNYSFLCFYVEYIYRKGYYGVFFMFRKICMKFWIVKLLKMVKLIRYNCVICKKLNK